LIHALQNLPPGLKEGAAQKQENNPAAQHREVEERFVGMKIFDLLKPGFWRGGSAHPMKNILHAA